MTESEPARAPDIVLLNGRIFTANAEHPFAEALAIAGEFISAIGTTESVSRLAGPQTRVIDLQGRLATPGFNDAHTHFSPDWVGKTLEFSGMEPSCEEVLKAIEAAVRTEPPGTVISGAIGATAFFHADLTPAKLTEIAPDHPVMLITWTPHAAILNRAMTKKLGVDEAAPPVAGGFFGKGLRSPRWDGVVHEYAAIGLHVRLLDASKEAAGLREMLGACVHWGITSLQLMALPTDSQHLVDLLAAVGTPIRVRIIPMPRTDARGRLKPVYPKIPASIANRVRVDGVKWLLDGTPVERSSAQLVPYADDSGWSGAMDFPPSEVRALLEEVRRGTTQPMFHIVGDRTMEAFLDALDATGGPSVWAQRRVRMEHGDGIAADLIPRVRQLGVVIVQNPTHLTLDPLFASRFGPEGVARYQPFRSLQEAGIPLALGSDGEMNPFLNVMLASLFPRRPDEALRREDALIAYTATAAYAEFEETRKGTLEAGKLADIAVLSQDILRLPPPELPKTHSVLTIVGGTIVHNALG